MPGSLSVPVKKAVITGLTDYLAGLTDFNGAGVVEDLVEVSYAYNFGSTAAQRVYTGRSRAETPPAAQRSGRNHRNESGQFEINVLVQLPGGSTEEADQRASDIGDAIEEWIADRKSGEGMGVAHLNSLYVDRWESDYIGVDRGSAAIRTYTVRWTARLT